MSRRLADLAKTIDHTLLDPEAPDEAIVRLCEEALEHHFASVCVLPGAVPLAAERLRGCDVKVAAVVGFPLGAEADKEGVAARCVAAGAHELDVVLDARAMLAGDVLRVRDELAAVVQASRMRGVNTGRGQTLVKVVVACRAIGRRHAQLACRIAADVQADFVVTSTGGGSSPDALDDVELLRERLPEGLGLKAAGAVATAAEALELLGAGAARIGTVHAVDVVAPPAALPSSLA